jgi:hypothetical protein
MELLHQIMDGLTPHDGLSPALKFFVENAPFVTALTAAVFTLFTLLEVVAFRRHRAANQPGHRPGFIEKIRPYILIFGIFAATLFGLIEIHTKWMRKPQEIIWKEQVASSLNTCLDKFRKLPQPAQDRIHQRLQANYESEQLHCLANAIQRSGPGALGIDTNLPVATRFRLDVRLADTLLAIDGVPKILSVALSIDDKRFLGYGYNLSERMAKYSEAANREYFVRNGCASVKVDGDRCTTSNSVSRRVFTWILNPDEIATDPNEKISSLLKRIPPSYGADHYKTYFGTLETGRLMKTPPVLIRFSKFSESAYVGTLGRTDATYVFFSNLAEFWDKSLADAEIASGRIASSWGTPNQRVFIWVYFPSGEDEAREATWESVMNLLKDLRIDAEISAMIQGEGGLITHAARR